MMVDGTVRVPFGTAAFFMSGGVFAAMRIDMPEQAHVAPDAASAPPWTSPMKQNSLIKKNFCLSAMNRKLLADHGKTIETQGWLERKHMEIDKIFASYVRTITN